MTTQPHRFLLPLFAFVLVAVRAAAQPHDLAPGPYAVGFRVVNAVDRSRTIAPERDFEGRPYPGDAALPVQISLWYPARPAPGARPLRFADYLYFSQRKDAPGEVTAADRTAAVEALRASAPFQIGRPLTDAEVDGILQAGMAAFPDAAPEAGPFPLVLGGLERPSVSAPLAEYLASHGYVVVTTPSLSRTATQQATQPRVALETQTRNLEYLLAFAHAQPFVDTGRMAVAGINFDGMAALVFQMRNMSADAVVSLDGWEGKASGAAIVQTSPYFDVLRLRVPYLLFVQDDPPDARFGADLTLFDALRYAERYHYVVDGLAHGHYVGTLAAWPEVRTRHAAAYGFTYRTILHFLDAYVRERPERLGFLQTSAAGNGYPADLLEAEVKHPALPPMPTAEEYERIVMAADTARAARLFRDGRRADPGLALFDEQTMNLFAFRFQRQGRADVARALRELSTEAFPQSVQAWRSLGDAYRDEGRADAARQSFEHALALLPAAAMNADERAAFEQDLRARIDALRKP